MSEKKLTSIIGELEKKYSVELPVEYKLFLEEYNGCFFDDAFNEPISIPYTEYCINLKVLYGIGLENENDLSFNNEKYIDEANKNIFVIGECKEGGLLVYNFNEQINGICYWDNELKLSVSKEDGNAYFLFDNFGELLNLFVEENSKDEKEEVLMDRIEYLPLGSVVVLEGGIQKILIISRGLLVENNGTELFFDYAGVPYPAGLTGNDAIYFSHASVDRVIFEGFKDDDDKVVVNNINNYIQKNPNLIRGNADNWVD